MIVMSQGWSVGRASDRLTIATLERAAELAGHPHVPVRFHLDCEQVSDVETAIVVSAILDDGRYEMRWRGHAVTSKTLGEATQPAIGHAISERATVEIVSRAPGMP